MPPKVITFGAVHITVPSNNHNLTLMFPANIEIIKFEKCVQYNTKQIESLPIMFY